LKESYVLKFNQNKAVDILLSTIAFDLGEDQVADALKIQRIEQFEKLFNDYNFTVNHSPEEVKFCIDELDRLLNDLNEILSISNYKIHKKALEEMLEYAIKYKKDRSLAKTLDTIFQVVNEARGKLRHEKIENINEIRIQNERWRLYFDGNQKTIVGFDYEHKTNNHRDVIPKFKNRI
jgi:hypothetical protein